MTRVESTISEAYVLHWLRVLHEDLFKEDSSADFFAKFSQHMEKRNQANWANIEEITAQNNQK